MSKFTKGGWKYLEALYQVTAYPEPECDFKQDGRGWPVYPDGGWWQDITGELCGNDEEEIHANGRLIASAPEMYGLIASIANLPDEQCMISPLIHEARRLIARIDNEEAD